MSKTPPDSGAPRPFSFRPQDFGAPERVAKASDPEEKADDADELPFSQREPDTAPTGSAGRASTQALRSSEASPPQPKSDQTILMAVPPPAQENKGE